MKKLFKIHTIYMIDLKADTNFIDEKYLKYNCLNKKFRGVKKQNRD